MALLTGALGLGQRPPAENVLTARKNQAAVPEVTWACRGEEAWVRFSDVSLERLGNAELGISVNPLPFSLPSVVPSPVLRLHGHHQCGCPNHISNPTVTHPNLKRDCTSSLPFLDEILL